MVEYIKNFFGQEENISRQDFMKRINVKQDPPSGGAQSIIPSGFFGNSSENIVELKNFLTPEEQKTLSDFALKNDVWDVTQSQKNENGTVTYDANVWADRVATRDSLMESDSSILPLIESMQERLKIEVDKFFNVNVRATGPAVVRWPIGTRQEPHADKELHEGPDAGTPNAFPWYDIASIFYFNDDYEGGEIYFPIQGLEYKPKAGSAYFFPGDMNYVHGVRPVISGNRFTSPFFWTVKEYFGDKKL
jgi:predicted 2-oxoglutarate/Fe(II)-dependent dioxygenase YbiX